MLMVTRYVVPGVDAVEFHELGRLALQALAARPGCTGGRLGRSIDDPTLWTLTTTWRSVGDYRRALSSYDVKVNAVPLMYRAIDEPTAFEDLLSWSPEAGLSQHETARSADADRASRASGRLRG